jgi:hypothetical protein
MTPGIRTPRTRGWITWITDSSHTAHLMTAGLRETDALPQCPRRRARALAMTRRCPAPTDAERLSPRPLAFRNPREYIHTRPARPRATAAPLASRLTPRPSARPTRPRPPLVGGKRSGCSTGELTCLSHVALNTAQNARERARRRSPGQADGGWWLVAASFLPVVRGRVAWGGDGDESRARKSEMRTRGTREDPEYN